MAMLLKKSKRGGGGYIRIDKVDLAENQSVLDDLTLIGTEITENQAYQLISSLYEDGVFSQKRANYVLAAISRQALDLPTEMENMIRARILVRYLKSIEMRRIEGSNGYGYGRKVYMSAKQVLVLHNNKLILQASSNRNRAFALALTMEKNGVAKSITKFCSNWSRCARRKWTYRRIR